MNQDREFAAMADSCIAAQVAIERSGTPEMKTLIRILLFQIGQELGRRELGRRELARREAERPKTSR